MDQSPGVPSGATSPIPCDWYADIEVYERAFAFRPERELRCVLSVLEAYQREPGSLILEPMVGHGRLAVPLQDQGFRVVGYDISPTMVRRARHHGLKLAFRADAGNAALAPVFDAAYCLIDSIRYLLSFEASLNFLQGTACALKTGSPFAIELELAGREPPAPDEWEVANDSGVTRAKVQWGGMAGPDVEWMIAEVDCSDAEGRRRWISRRKQRRWTPEAFLRLLDDADLLDIVGIWRRGQVAGPGLGGIPKSGGPVFVLLERNEKPITT